MTEETEELENVSQESVKQFSAEETASAPKKVIGRPITKETAKQYQLSAARAKRLRKEARAKMLEAMCTKLELGDEMVNAIKKNDDTKMNIIEKALKIVGLTHDQSSEATAQKLEVKSDSNVKGNFTTDLKINFVDAPKKE